MEIKMDLRIQSREFITEFINVFRENPCLWKTSLIEYKIKSVKQSAYHKLLEISRKYEPQTSIDDVKKKIQSLRASHRKERRKVKDSLRTGSGIDEIYVPKLWYYTELDFLDDQEESKYLITYYKNVMQPSNFDLIKICFLTVVVLLRLLA